jgi:hypothetical protein
MISILLQVKVVYNVILVVLLSKSCVVFVCLFAVNAWRIEGISTR